MTSRSLATVGPSLDELPRRHEGLIVLDVDEVVLHFIAPFCALLAEHGAQLHFESFRLTGNVRSISTGAAVSGHELDRITQRLYAEQEIRQEPVHGVADALSRLREMADIIFLTAMTPGFYDQRRRLLDKAGLDFPMIATERAKGAVLGEIEERRKGPIAFVDDLPPNLEGVRRSVPSVHLVHLMANRDFRPHLPPMPSGTAQADSWLDAEAILTRMMLLKQTQNTTEQMA